MHGIKGGIWGSVLPHCILSPVLVQSGINGFTCKLDGIKGKVHCNTDSLHATEPPPPDTTLQPFEPELLAKALPVPELEGFLQGVQEDPPIDLRRSKPDSGVWYDVLTGQRCVSSLPDDEVARLRYLVPGGSSYTQGWQARTCHMQLLVFLNRWQQCGARLQHRASVPAVPPALPYLPS